MSSYNAYSATRATSGEAASATAVSSPTARAALLAGAIALLVYIFTLPTDLTWANFSSDGPELITAAMTLGIPHPPGYPTYILLGKLAGLLPLGSVALRFHLLSAAAGVTAAAFNAAAATRQTGKWPAGLVAGMMLAFAPLVWGQALVAEVYALNLAFLAAFLWALLGQRPSLLTGALLGLSLTSHLTSALMLPLALLITPRARWSRLLVGVGLGLLPLLALPLLARGDSPVVWGDPTTLGGWWWLVSGQLYHATLGLPPAGEFWTRAGEWSSLLLRQFAWIGLLALPLGLLRARSAARDTVSLLATAVAYIIYGFFYQTNDAQLYLLPAILLLVLALAPGLAHLGRWALLLPMLLLMLNASDQNLRTQSGDVRAHAQTLLTAAPQNAILLTPGDRSIFTLWYFQHVEQQRPDLALIDANLLAFDWYRARLQAQYPDLHALERDDVDALRAENVGERPFCTITLLNPQNLDCYEE